jgi:predicted dehydrogenase
MYRIFRCIHALVITSLLFSTALPAQEKTQRVGMIGLDTSHSIAFARLLNADDPIPELAGYRVVVACPRGSADIESSTSRIPKYTEQIKELGVTVVDSVAAVVTQCDVVLLETNDGRPHLEQVLEVFQAGKPVFIDKPIAGSLADTLAIFRAAEKYKVPVFSSSSLRFSKGAQAIRNGSMGTISGADTYSPCSLEKTHPDLYWYGIHGVEMLFTVMGAGCQTVTRVSAANTDIAVGHWKDGRVGTFRGSRGYSTGYGGTVFGEKGAQPIGGYDGYQPLVVEIIRFYRTGTPPVSATETIDIYAFMEAADESKRRGGVPVTLKEVIRKATPRATKRLKQLERN